MKISDLIEWDENEKPLDRIAGGGGYCAILRTIGCIGDSLSSGEFEAVIPGSTTKYHDIFEYSWGQFLARMCGITVYNFSQGGMTAKEYIDSFADQKGFFDPKYKCKAYIIALGLNDLYFQNHIIGTKDDIKPDMDNACTFIGYYGKIIQKYKQISPDAKFFLVTSPKNDDDEKRLMTNAKKLRDAVYTIAECFDNTYIIDLYEYAPIYNQKFRDKFFLGGHMNPCGYLLSAKIIASYIDYIIRHNLKDFEMTAFI